MIINILKFKKVKKFKKNNYQVNAVSYWKIILWITGAIILVSFVFSFFLFQDTNREIIVAVPLNSGKVETVKKERMEKVLQSFSDRVKKSTDILNSYSPIIDPSR